MSSLVTFRDRCERASLASSTPVEDAHDVARGSHAMPRLPATRSRPRQALRRAPPSHEARTPRSTSIIFCRSGITRRRFDLLSRHVGRACGAFDVEVDPPRAGQFTPTCSGAQRNPTTSVPAECARQTGAASIAHRRISSPAEALHAISGRPRPARPGSGPISRRSGSGVCCTGAARCRKPADEAQRVLIGETHPTAQFSIDRRRSTSMFADRFARPSALLVTVPDHLDRLQIAEVLDLQRREQLLERRL